MAYDSLRDATVLLQGGLEVLQGQIDDMWVFDGSQWTRQLPASRPPARDWFAMAYDAGRDRLVVFGGRTGTSYPGTYLQDTWEWDGSQWTERFPLHLPSRRAGHYMVYDRVGHHVVMYGGIESVSLPGLRETWVWDGNDWLQIPTANAPPGAMGSAMAYDAARQRVVLFGGQGVPSFSTFFDQTWEWDGTDWTQRAPTAVPTARSSGTMAYDDARGVVLLYGGSTLHDPLGDTWLWDGTDWQQIVTHNTPTRVGHAMVYETARQQLLVFGGWQRGSSFTDDTWAFTDLVAPPSYTPFGVACPGSAGAPVLTWSDSLPFLGATFQMDLRQLPQSTFGFMMLGFSDTGHWHLWLPAELSSFLMPGCWLYTDIVDAPYFGVADGKARCPLPIPMVPDFEGLRFFSQALIHDPTANARGFTTTNAAAAVIGSWR